MKINDIRLLGFLAPIWPALGLQFVLFLQPGSLRAAFGNSPGTPIS